MKYSVRMRRWTMGRGLVLGVATLWFVHGLRAHQQAPDDLGTRLLALPAVAQAMARAEVLEPWVVEQQIALCEVPAPPFKEQARAEAYRVALQQLGLRNVRIDAVGNVRADRPGTGPRPHLVFSAHLDTVFPEGTDVRVRREGTRLIGPGIADDCRGLAVLLGVVRALDEAQVATPGPITFVGTVGEEGLGDLRGVKHLFADPSMPAIDRFVSVDGGGVQITNGGVGSRRYRVTFTGPGGHSYGAFGLANPIHALGRAVAAVGAFQVPAQPKTTFNVGRIGGGTSVNAIPSEAWMEVDLRSEHAGTLGELDARFRAAVAAAVAAENGRWPASTPVTADVRLVGDRPAGRTADTSAIVRAAASVLRALDMPVSLETSSTDANVAMAAGVPAITIGGGGTDVGTHSLEEAIDLAGSAAGTRQALLMAIALSQP